MPRAKAVRSAAARAFRGALLFAALGLVEGCHPVNLCTTAAQMQGEKSVPCCVLSPSGVDCLACPPGTICENWTGIPAPWSNPEGTCCRPLPLGCDPNHVCSCSGFPHQAQGPDPNACYACSQEFTDAGSAIACNLWITQ